MCDLSQSQRSKKPADDPQTMAADEEASPPVTLSPGFNLSRIVGSASLLCSCQLHDVTSSGGDVGAARCCVVVGRFLTGGRSQLLLRVFLPRLRDTAQRRARLEG